MYSVSKIFNIFIFFALALLVISCYKEEDYNYSSNDIFRDVEITISPDTLVANGDSTTTITYKFSEEVNDDLINLLISTSNGTFVESKDDTLEINLVRFTTDEKHKIVQATLLASNSPGDVIIRTKLLDNVDIREVTFIDASTTSISLDATPFFIKNDTIESITLSASLGSEYGIASKGKKIFLNATPDSVGFFQSNTISSGADGAANATYIFTNTAHVGLINFIAKTLNENGDTLTASSQVRVLD